MRPAANIEVKPVLLAVDDERENLELLERVFTPDWEVECEIDPTRALARFQADKYTVVVTDLRMPRMDGAMLIQRLQLIDPSLVCILVTGYGDLPEVHALKEKGAVCRVILKPWDMDDLRSAVESAARFTRMRRAVSTLRAPR